MSLIDTWAATGAGAFTLTGRLVSLAVATLLANGAAEPRRLKDRAIAGLLVAAVRSSVVRRADTLSISTKNLCDDYHSGHEPRLVPVRAQSKAGETNGKF
jgi:hypothetical protein